MRSISIALPVCLHCAGFEGFRLRSRVESLAGQSSVARILLACRTAEDEAGIRGVIGATGKVTVIRVDSWISAAAMTRLLEETKSDGLLLNLRGADLEFHQKGLEELMTLAEISGARLVHSDYRQVTDCGARDILTIDYQAGSVRESFDFGPAVLVARRAAEDALRRHGPIAEGVRWCGFYDLRLKLSIDGPLVHSAEPAYCERVIPGVRSKTAPRGVETVFYEPERENRDYQIETERVVTEHLRRIGVHVESGRCPPPMSHDEFPVTASIVIPTRNRERTIAESLESALGQVAAFDYNVLVIDDHSTDRTGEIIERFGRQHSNIFHLIPERLHLGIGGMWNTAIDSPYCGRYAVQLDSDDVYAHNRAVEALVNEFGAEDDGRKAPRYAMVVGSYQRVNATLGEMPCGLNQRLEFSRENGRNNLLCLDGPGAPRAFYVPALRQAGFPDVSFGEDYAVALRLAREYDIGRVYECLYFARQWDGNTGHTLPLGSVKALDLNDVVPPGMDQPSFWTRIRPIVEPLVMASVNRNNAYKDYLRTVEIQARKRKGLAASARDGASNG
jgi:glycosyltransferase involved in cell wall biosynthesis